MLWHNRSAWDIFINCLSLYLCTYNIALYRELPAWIRTLGAWKKQLSHFNKLPEKYWCLFVICCCLTQRGPCWTRLPLLWRMDSQRNSLSSSSHLPAPSWLSAPGERHMKRLKHRRKGLMFTQVTPRTPALHVYHCKLSCPSPTPSCQDISFTILMPFFFLTLRKHCYPKELANLTASRACAAVTVGSPFPIP